MALSGAQINDSILSSPFLSLHSASHHFPNRQQPDPITFWLLLLISTVSLLKRLRSAGSVLQIFEHHNLELLCVSESPAKLSSDVFKIVNLERTNILTVKKCF